MKKALLVGVLLMVLVPSAGYSWWPRPYWRGHYRQSFFYGAYGYYGPYAYGPYPYYRAYAPYAYPYYGYRARYYGYPAYPYPYYGYYPAYPYWGW
jgi:hypothetical protein